MPQVNVIIEASGVMPSGGDGLLNILDSMMAGSNQTQNQAQTNLGMQQLLE